MSLDAEGAFDYLDRHLSQISTPWTTFVQAHGGPPEGTQVAFQRILERYQRAVYRYLLAALKTPDAANEVFQEFALKLVRGDFKRAESSRGRLRDFFKTSLYHLIVDQNASTSSLRTTH